MSLAEAAEILKEAGKYSIRLPPVPDDDVTGPDEAAPTAMRSPSTAPRANTPQPGRATAPVVHQAWPTEDGTIVFEIRVRAALARHGRRGGRQPRAPEHDLISTEDEATEQQPMPASQRDPWRIHFFHRHVDDDPDGAVAAVGASRSEQP